MSVPSYPNPASQVPQARTVEPPSTVTGAFMIYLAIAALSLIGIIVTLTSDVWTQAINDGIAGANTQGVTVEQIVSIAKTVTIVVGAVFLALYLLFAFKMRAGRNWARIVLTVLSALSILSAVSTGSANVNGRVYSSGLSTTISWITVALAVVAIVLMYLSPSNVFFRNSKAARELR